MAAPTVTSLNPTTGPTSGGTAVLIIGTVLTGATAVSFGGVPATSFVVSSATVIAATAPAHAVGTAQVIVTTPGGVSSEAVDYTYTAATSLFTVAEARAFDKGQLSNPVVFSDAAIIAKEVSIRARFERIIGVALVSTVSTEYYDGANESWLYLNHHNPFAETIRRPVTLTSVTVIATDDTETAYTTAELADVVRYPDKLYRRSGTFVWGHRNHKVVFTHGYTTVPDDIKTAALLACIQELVPTNIPSSVIDGSDGQINWSRVKDPGRGRWYGNESIDAVLREHQTTENLPGLA